VNRELESLTHLAYKSGRSLIVPNLLGDERIHAGGLWRDRRMWPGFRVAFSANPALIEILEPGHNPLTTIPFSN
jgi:hypothetical protein